MYAIKLALAVVLCGGVEREDTNGTRVRGEPHMVQLNVETLHMHIRITTCCSF